ncbi:site-specific integrase [Dysgonomonas sp.]
MLFFALNRILAGVEIEANTLTYNNFRPCCFGMLLGALMIRCCFTGIAYIDVANLTTDNIYEDGFGQKWLRLSRQKSDVEANIPLLEIPLSIIRKYRKLGSDKLLPMHTNQKMNEYLKEIANLCGIKKKLTTRSEQLC